MAIDHTVTLNLVKFESQNIRSKAFFQGTRQFQVPTGVASQLATLLGPIENRQSA